jgi:hypothetical protein
MRHFYTLDHVEINEGTGVLTLSDSTPSPFKVMLSLRREGGYVAISVSSGPLEMALRPKAGELARVLGQLMPVSGLQTTRQVGTGEAYLAVGLRTDGTLVLRPTIVADATGLLCFNLLVADAARAALFGWLPADAESHG